MKIYQLIAIVLIIAGTLGLVYGGFSFISDSHEAQVGGLSLTVNEKEYFQIPVWGGVVSIALGALLLLLRRKS